MNGRRQGRKADFGIGRPSLVWPAAFLLAALWAPLWPAFPGTLRLSEGTQGAGVVRISGSDTMLVLVRGLAENFMRSRTGISVHVWGGGTGRGMEDLVRGRVEICAASRPLQTKEASRLAESFGSVGFTFPVAKEALSVYVHPENPVRDLSLQELKAVFTGRVTDWRELGGPPGLIRVIRRPSTSGTFAYFKEHVLEDEPYSPRAETAPDHAAIVARVSADSRAIGYGGLAFGKSLHIRVNGIAPTEEEIRNDRYPITRYLYLVTRDRPRGASQQFLDWVLGPEGQAVVSQTGYLALW